MKKDRPKSDLKLNQHFEKILSDRGFKSTITELSTKVKNGKIDLHIASKTLLTEYKLPSVFFWKLVSFLEEPKGLEYKDKGNDIGYIGHKDEIIDYKNFINEFEENERIKSPDLEWNGSFDEWETQEENISENFPLKIYFSALATTDEMKKYIDENAVKIRKIQARYRTEKVAKIIKQKKRKTTHNQVVLDIISENINLRPKQISEILKNTTNKILSLNTIADIKKREKQRVKLG